MVMKTLLVIFEDTNEHSTCLSSARKMILSRIPQPPFCDYLLILKTNIMHLLLGFLYQQDFEICMETKEDFGPSFLPENPLLMEEKAGYILVHYCVPLFSQH